METAKFISLLLHVIAGISTLIAGPIAIYFNYRDTKSHKIAGKLFFYAMMVTCVTGVIGWLKRPDMAFYQFLLGISLMVFGQVWQGVRAIRIMKGAKRSWLDFLAFASLVGASFWMLSRGYIIYQTTHSALAILFLVFGTFSGIDVFRQLKRLLKFSEVTPIEWYKIHIGMMIGGFIASTTAFMVNVANFLPWYLQWFLPTFLLIPITIYFTRKVSRKNGSPTNIV